MSVDIHLEGEFDGVWERGFGRREKGGRRNCNTSASNFLNSSSFFCLYSSISFWASERASFTLFVRSMEGRYMSFGRGGRRAGFCGIAFLLG